MNTDVCLLETTPAVGDPKTLRASPLTTRRDTPAADRRRVRGRERRVFGLEIVASGSRAAAPGPIDRPGLLSGATLFAGLYERLTRPLRLPVLDVGTGDG